MVDKIYFDRLTCRLILNPEPTRPLCSYIEVIRGVNDGIIIEQYSDGDKKLNYSYSSNTLRNLINIHVDAVRRQRKDLFEHNPGNWAIYSMTLPTEEFEQILELCDSK